jgi:uncharacterized protein (TIGR03437 family)
MIRLTLVLLLAASLDAADFYNGQAARAVLGQSSFSSRDAGIAVSAMTIQNGRLNIAQQSGLVSVFDLASIPGVYDELARPRSESCPVCGFAPLATISQSVAPGSSTVSMFGHRMAAIDQRTHRILIWHDVTSQAANSGPDVTLNLTDPGVLSVNESTIIDPVSVAVDGARLFVGDAALHRVLVWRTLPLVPNQPADVVLGQPDFETRDAAESPRADTITRPDALVSDGVNLFVGDSHDRRVLVFSAADGFLPAESILNSASLSTGPLAPGTLATIKGEKLTTAEISAPDDRPAKLPTKLGGAEVYLNGRAVPLLSVTPDEIRVQMPYTLASLGSGSLYVRAERPDGSVAVTAPASVSFSSAAPGIFAFSGPEPRPGILLHANEQGGPGSPVTEDAPASPGEIVSLWVTGLHPLSTSPEQMPVAGYPFPGGELSFSPVRAVVNGQPAEVVDTTLPPTSIGVYQVLVLLPSSLARDKAEISLAEDGFTSNSVTFPLHKP